ncbi:MAG: hypothetical protein ACXWJ9_16655, partial [Caldimonas sp.]
MARILGGSTAKLVADQAKAQRRPPHRTGPRRAALGSILLARLAWDLGDADRCRAGKKALMEHPELHALLRKMAERGASDLYLTCGAPPHLKVQGQASPLPLPALQSGQAGALAYSTMSAAQI